MRRLGLVAVLLVVLAPGLALGQSLGELAKKEKKRRERNRADNVRVRTITEEDIAPAPPPPPKTATSEEGEPLFDLPGVGSERNSDSESSQAALPAAPNFTLPDRSGRSVSLSQFRGKPVLIDFWATWCAPCRQTMPEIERLHRSYGLRGLQVVGINIEGRSDDVLSYLDQGRYSFTVLFSSGNWQSEVAQQYGVNSIPQTFLLDANGRIVYSGHPAGLAESSITALLR